MKGSPPAELSSADVSFHCATQPAYLLDSTMSLISSERRPTSEYTFREDGMSGRWPLAIGSRHVCSPVGTRKQGFRSKAGGKSRVVLGCDGARQRVRGGPMSRLEAFHSCVPIAAIGLAIGILYLYCKCKLSYWSSRGVKTPPTHWLFGNFKDVFTFKKPPGQVLRDIYDWAEPEDPYIGFYIFHKPMLLVRDLELIKRIMVKDFDVFPNRRFGSVNEKDSVGLVNLLGIKQPRWKFLRSKLSAALTGQKLKRMIPLMVECGEDMSRYIDGAPPSAGHSGWKSFELKNMASRYTTDVISSVAFGIASNCFREPDGGTFWEAGQKILTGFTRGLIVIVVFFLPRLGAIIEPITKKPADFFRQIFWHSMSVREETGEKREDMIDFFLRLKNAEQSAEFRFEGDNLLAQAVAFYVAGFEASSTAIAFTLFELARHPEHQTRLYQEIRTAQILDAASVYQSGEATPFLDRVLSEALRLYPPLPFVDRVALEDYALPGGNLVIERGTPVYVSITGSSYDPRYFSNPDQFLPGRHHQQGHGLPESLAFGLGPRSCIGRRMGQLITKVAIITIIRNYLLSCEYHGKELFNPASAFTNPIAGLHVRFKRRERVPGLTGKEQREQEREQVQE
ncbi:hypothetical protein KM043_001014 [Ampulex compressa]|nr:hypothetical protein KM043_001014 [Ampulex compressa]